MKNYILLLITLISFQTSAQDRTTYSKLSDYFDSLAVHNRFMGNALIMKGTKVVFQKSVGMSQIEEKQKHTQTDIFRIGSITKTYTAAIVLKLIEDKKISFDTQLATFFSEIKNAEDITIQQMLQHASGLANYTNEEEFVTYMHEPQSQEKMIERIEKLKSDFTPGSKHEYSNTNFLLLGYIIERVSGKTYAQNLEQYIVQPLNLKNTFYSLDTTSLAKESASYVYQEGWKKMPNWNLDVAAAAGAIRATAKDLALFVRALFQSDVLEKSSLKAMMNFEKSFGLGLLEAPFYDKKLLMHGGKIEGFHSQYFHSKDDDVTFVILCNASNFNQNQIAIAMASAYYGRDFSIPSMKEKKEVTVPVLQLKKYVGEYVTESFPLDITVSIKDEKLIAQATGQGAFPLQATALNRFEFSTANIKIEFLQTEKGYSRMKFSQGGSRYIFNKK